MHPVIIGAGLAGLAAANTLREAGLDPIVIDKGRGPGGRLATRRLGGGGFDTGAQFFSVRDQGFARAVAAWEAAGLVTRWCDGFPVRADGLAATNDGHPRYRVVGGMNRLAKHLAQGIEVRDQRTVTGITAGEAGWVLTVEAGDLMKPGAAATGPSGSITGGAVILTAPGPQSAALLQRSGLAVPAELAAVRYDPCLCLLVDVPAAAGPLLPPPGAVRFADDGPIAWIASQRAKELRSSGEGLVIHAGGYWSAERYGRDDAQILADLVPAAEAALERCGVRLSCREGQLKKWKYSLPTVTTPQDTVLIPGPAPLLVAGDSCGGRPRVEGAWCSGVAAARSLLVTWPRATSR